jgi:hypothetical protein
MWNRLYKQTKSKNHNNVVGEVVDFDQSEDPEDRSDDSRNSSQHNKHHGRAHQRGNTSTSNKHDVSSEMSLNVPDLN